MCITTQNHHHHLCHTICNRVHIYTSVYKGTIVITTYIKYHESLILVACIMHVHAALVTLYYWRTLT